MSVRPDWSMKRVQGQPRFCRETLSQKKERKKTICKCPPGFDIETMIKFKIAWSVGQG